MAKELPYYKHEPSEWLEGEIQACSDAAIVCFSNLCSGYWLKLGCISIAFALHKYCRRDPSILNELIENGIVRVEEDQIRISFLDKQLESVNELSKKRSENARKRWQNKNENAKALQLHSKSNAIREDKIREDNIKEKEELHSSKEKPSFNFRKALIQENFDPKLVEDWIQVRKTKRAANTETAFKIFLNQILQAERTKGIDRNELLELTVSRSWQTFKIEYLENLNQNNNAQRQQPTGAEQRRNVEQEILRRSLAGD